MLGSVYNFITSYFLDLCLKGTSVFPTRREESSSKVFYKQCVLGVFT